MKVEEIKIDNLELEYLKNIHKGVQEFVDLIESMEKELPALNVKIAFMSGMVGYSCQAIVHEKKENYFLISTTNNKKYITGDPLNYYLFDSEYSLYNILMGQFHKIFPNLEIPKIQPFIERVTLNLGNDKYLIKCIFNTEKIFDFELYRSTWKKFYNTLTKYCKKPEDWSMIFSLTLSHYLEKININCGKLTYLFFVNIALENAIYVSRIFQK